MTNHKTTGLSRRQFLATTAAGTAATLAAPAILTAKKTDSQIILGDGAYRYAVQHDWAQLPQEFEWQTTHNCTIDRNGFVYTGRVKALADAAREAGLSF